MRRQTYLAIWAILALTGCSEGKIDGSSDAAMKDSVEEIKSSLSAEKAQEFQESLKTLAASKIDIASLMKGETTREDILSSTRSSLDGKTADQVISEAQQIIAAREAKQKEQALQEISELETKREQAESAGEALSKFEVVKSRLYKREDGYLTKPIIELTVVNNTERPVARAFFNGTVASPGRSIPWIQESFNYSIPGGLEPGESADWSLAPNMFSKWGTDVPNDAVLTLETSRLKGPGYEVSSEMFTEQDKERLEKLRAQYQQ